MGRRALQGQEQEKAARDQGALNKAQDNPEDPVRNSANFEVAGCKSVYDRRNERDAKENAKETHRGGVTFCHSHILDHEIACVAHVGLAEEKCEDNRRYSDEFLNQPIAKAKERVKDEKTNQKKVEYQSASPQSLFYDLLDQ